MFWDVAFRSEARDLRSATCWSRRQARIEGRSSQHRGVAVFAVLRMTRTVRLCSPWNLFNVREHPCLLRERLDGMSDTGGLIPGNTSPWKQSSLFLLPAAMMDSSSRAAAAERGSFSDCSWRSHMFLIWFTSVQMFGQLFWTLRRRDRAVSGRFYFGGAQGWGVWNENITLECKWETVPGKYERRMWGNVLMLTLWH